MSGLKVRLEALRLAVSLAKSCDGATDDDVITVAKAFEAFLAGDSKEGPGDWIEWAGGECPLAGHVVVDVRLSGGDPREPSMAGNFRWRNLGGDYDIVAYRVMESGK